MFLTGTTRPGLSLYPRLRGYNNFAVRYVLDASIAPDCIYWGRKPGFPVKSPARLRRLCCGSIGKIIFRAGELVETVLVIAVEA